MVTLPNKPELAKLIETAGVEHEDVGPITEVLIAAAAGSLPSAVAEYALRALDRTLEDQQNTAWGSRNRAQADSRKACAELRGWIDRMQDETCEQDLEHIDQAMLGLRAVAAEWQRSASSGHDLVAKMRRDMDDTVGHFAEYEAPRMAAAFLAVAAMQLKTKEAHAARYTALKSRHLRTSATGNGDEDDGEAMNDDSDERGARDEDDGEED